MRRALAGVGASKGLALGRARVRHPHVLTLSEETIAPDAIEAELLGEPPPLLSVPRGSIDALRDTLFVLVAGLLGGMSLNRMRRERMWRARW